MVKLNRLAEQLNLKANGEGDPELLGITEDSREVRPGWLFVAVPGLKFDGRDFIETALTAGAAAVMIPDEDRSLDVPRLVVPAQELRSFMAAAASVIYGSPSEKMALIGLTGTNGKTTTAYLMESILKLAGLEPGVLGTINFRWPGTVRTAPNTTPEGPVLSACLAEMVDRGSKAAVMEISSHALALGRVTGQSFRAALFTNLSRDHLDFHRDMEDYYQAKKLLFTRCLKAEGKKAVINIDDAYGRRLTTELGSGVLTFGFAPEAEVRGSDLKLTRSGLSLEVEFEGRRWTQTSPLLAEVNAYNVLAATALSLALNIGEDTIKSALTQARGAPGRLDKVGDNSDYLVLIDYAHSPDALDKALTACRELEPKRLITVFGCGGDRDRGKRPLMGQLAGQLADLIILTSDNPRTEEPWSILLEVEAGLASLNLIRYEGGELASDDWAPGAYMMIVDRRTAIREAARLMEPGDILLIAGKGHEDYQIIGREKRKFDDRQEVLAALKRAGHSL